MNRLKVLHLIENLGGGGKERQLLELMKFDDKRVVSEVVIFKDQISYSGVELLNFKLHILKRKVKKDMSVIFKLKHIINEFKPDIIHAWGSMPSIYALPFFFFKSDAIFVNMMIRNAICKPFSQNWFRSKLTFPFSHIILGNSYAGVENYKAPLSKSGVVYNGIHLNRFENLPDKQVVKNELGIKTEFVVGMVAVYHPRKDYQSFVDAAKQVLKKRNDTTFVIIGDGPGLEAFIQKNKLHQEPGIKFLGRRQDIEECMVAFDIGVLMTNPKIHREGISNSIVEYMASELPVIASFGGGTAEIVDHNFNGFLVRPFDVNGFCRKVEYFLENKDVMKHMGRMGRQKVIEGFTIDIMANEIYNIYDGMVKDKHH